MLSSLYLCKSYSHFKVQLDAHPSFQPSLTVSRYWFPAHLNSVSVYPVFGLFGWAGSSRVPAVHAFFLSRVLDYSISSSKCFLLFTEWASGGVVEQSSHPIIPGEPLGFRGGVYNSPCRCPGSERWSVYCHVGVRAPLPVLCVDISWLLVTTLSWPLLCLYRAYLNKISLRVAVNDPLPFSPFLNFSWLRKCCFSADQW